MATQAATAREVGAAISADGGTLTVINSTVSGNSADTEGGGIWNGGPANLFNSTVTNNRSDADLDGNGTGGGVFNSAATFNFQNTIIAENLETVFNAALGKRSLLSETARER